MTESMEVKGKSHRKWLLPVATIVLLAILFWIGWLPRQENNRKINALANETYIPHVPVMRVHPDVKPLGLVLPSSAQAWHFTPIWSRVNGYVIRWLVDIGDTVKGGDLLAELDTPETDELLAQAEADLLNAEAQRDIAKITSERWQTLWNKNREAVSKQEVDQFNANLQSTEALVLMNKKNVARYKYEQSFKYIYAPFDGTISQRSIDIGTLIYGTVNLAPQELYQIVQTDSIRFYVYVPQTYFTQIKEGLAAEVSIEQLPGKIFKGAVTRFAKALDPVARTLLTEVDIDNSEGLLYSGLYGNVKFLFTPEKTSFIIPTTAVIIRASRPHVAVVVDDNIVKLKRVEIGLDYGNKMEIISGLEENDLIITIPSDSIREGVKVYPLTEKK